MSLSAGENRSAAIAVLREKLDELHAVRGAWGDPSGTKPHNAKLMGKNGAGVRVLAAIVYRVADLVASAGQAPAAPSPLSTDGTAAPNI